MSEIKFDTAAIKEATSKAVLKPADYSDAGSRDVFCDTHGEEIRWTPGEGWRSYDGQIWQNDEGSVMERAVSFSADMLSEAKREYVRVAAELATAQANEADQSELSRLARSLKDAKTYLTFAQKSRNLYPLKNVVKLAESKLQMPDSAFDTDPDLVAVRNGVLNLQTGRLLPFWPDYYITKRMDVDFNPNADPTFVLEYLKTVFPDDEEKIPFFFRTIGYMLSGCPREDKVFIWHGETSRNGKTTIGNSLLNVFGSYGVPLSPDSLAASRFVDGSRARPDLMPLRGARLVVVEEPDHELVLNAGLIKIMTGGGAIQARQLRREQISFKMSGSIIMLCNRLPIVNDSSLFDSGRIMVLPFTRHFEEDEINPKLREELSKPENRSAWLNLILEGLQDYQRNGLRPPLCVQAATKEYSKRSDQLLNFLTTQTVKGSNTKAADVYLSYLQWSTENGFAPLTKGQFLDGLRKKKMLSDRATVNGKTEHNVVIGRQLVS